MRVAIEFSADDIAALRRLCGSERGKRALADRTRELEARCALTNANIWRSIVFCLVTTQQRSGPGSLVKKFCDTEPLALSLDRCHAWGGALRTNVASAISTAGLRRNEKIAEACARNLPILQDGEFDRIRRLLEELDADHSHVRERIVAVYMQRFHEIGPKQSRNFLINLGRMRYEIALDSRVLNWLRTHVIPPEAQALFKPHLFGHEDYYCFMLDHIRALCEDAGILPTLLDAAAFDVAGTHYTPPQRDLAHVCADDHGAEGTLRPDF